MTDDQVKAFLMQRPGFLRDHPELLFELEIEAESADQVQGGDRKSVV